MPAFVKAHSTWAVFVTLFGINARWPKRNFASFADCHEPFFEITRQSEVLEGALATTRSAEPHEKRRAAGMICRHAGGRTKCLTVAALVCNSPASALVGSTGVGTQARQPRRSLVPVHSCQLLLFATRRLRDDADMY